MTWILPKNLHTSPYVQDMEGLTLDLNESSQILRTVAFSEIEAYAVANLVAKMEAGLLDAAPIWTNLKTFPWREFRGKVDILSGGFPCQPFSSAGRRKGDEDPRHLFPYIKQGIQLLRPAIVFLENVEGIISSKLGEGWTDTEGTPVLLHVLRELERVDYKATAGVFSASEIGAPHQRKRIFIMAHANHIKCATGSLNFVHQNRRSMAGFRGSVSKEWSTSSNAIISNRDVWPSRRGEDQKEWEPRRVVVEELVNSLCFSQHNVEDDQSTDGEQDPKQASRMFVNARLSNDPLVNSNESRLERALLKEQSRETFPRSSSRSSSSRDIQREVKSSLGGDIDGSSDWMDYGDLCESVCNRTDELRLLGNGVVPSTAERAFRVLWEKIKKAPN